MSGPIADADSARKSLSGGGPDTGRTVTRNVFHLVSGQVITAFIAFVVTASVARHLGPRDYGVLFLSTSFVAIPFVFVELGQNYYAVSRIARDRSQAAGVFGSGLVLRLVVGALAFFPVMALARLLGYSELVQSAIALSYLFLWAMNIAAGFGVVFRGLERMDYQAVSQVGLKVLYGIASLAAVALNADVLGVIKAQALASALGLVLLVTLVVRLRVPRPQVRLETLGALVRGGGAFVIWNLIVATQGTVDSILLSKLATEEALGWYGAAQRLTIVLIFPAMILAAALYPTLSRLSVQAPEAFRQTTRSALRWTLFVGGLAAGGTYLFAQPAVALVYGESAFEPAADVLKILSVFVLTLYLNFVLGTAIMAAERTKPWIYAKGAAVIALVALNLALIPICQTRFGNGGLGSAIAAAIAELVLLGVALVLIPRGTLDRERLRDLARVAAGIAMMAAVTSALGDPSILIGAPLASLTYAAVIVALRGLSLRDLTELREALLSRSSTPAPGEP